MGMRGGGMGYDEQGLSLSRVDLKTRDTGEGNKEEEKKEISCINTRGSGTTHPLD